MPAKKKIKYKVVVGQPTWDADKQTREANIGITMCDDESKVICFDSKKEAQAYADKCKAGNRHWDFKIKPID